jgi:hypothetical protein
MAVLTPAAMAARLEQLPAVAASKADAVAKAASSRGQMQAAAVQRAEQQVGCRPCLWLPHAAVQAALCSLHARLAMAPPWNITHIIMSRTGLLVADNLASMNWADLRFIVLLLLHRPPPS